LYKQKLPGALKGPDVKALDDLEAKLSYEDIRFYRSIARAELRKDIQARRKIEEEKKKEQSAQGGGGWLNWMWGGSSSTNTEEILGVQMNDQKRKELFDALDYDEKANSVSYEPPKDALQARIKAKLQKGSLTLRSGQSQSSAEVMSIVFDDLSAKGVQRPTSLDAIISLGDLHVYDGTTPNSQYTEIVRIKKDQNTPTQSKVELGTAPVDEDEDEDALLMVKFEQAPLDERADNGLTVKLKSMEVVYHKNYVEAIYTFFKPPETQMESVAALLVCLYYPILRIILILLCRM
jgi:vacuolar protein sorting-associated protein 13A/C